VRKLFLQRGERKNPKSKKDLEKTTYSADTKKCSMDGAKAQAAL